MQDLLAFISEQGNRTSEINVQIDRYIPLLSLFVYISVSFVFVLLTLRLPKFNRCFFLVGGGSLAFGLLHEFAVSLGRCFSNWYASIDFYLLCIIYDVNFQLSVLLLLLPGLVLLFTFYLFYFL